MRVTACTLLFDAGGNRRQASRAGHLQAVDDLAHRGRPAAASPAGSSLALPGFSPRGEPGVAGGVVAGIVGVEVNEAALDLPVADLEDVAPAARAPFGVAGAPGAVGVFA